MEEEDRGQAMALRIELAARRAGLAEQADRIGEAVRAVLEHRRPAFPDVHHPDFLHPGRTALILLEDLGAADADLLLAALLRDSEQPALDLAADLAVRVAGNRAATIAASLPDAGLDPADRLEALVTLDNDALMVALAERLDHARHLHLQPPERWAVFHDGITRADLPAASRTHPRLAWRIQWWHDNFARRFLNTR
jgi:hypothetical protein